MGVGLQVSCNPFDRGQLLAPSATKYGESDAEYVWRPVSRGANRRERDRVAFTARTQTENSTQTQKIA